MQTLQGCSLLLGDAVFSSNSEQLCNFAVFGRIPPIFFLLPGLCGRKPCGEASKVNRAEQKRSREAFHWGKGGLVLEAKCPQLDLISAHSPLFHTQERFKPFQCKPGVIAGRDLGFLWILAQTRLLSTRQEKCTDSLIYPPFAGALGTLS